MKEAILQYIFENKLFDNEKTISFTGEKIDIIETGQRNTDAGPDFFNAKVKINDTIWVGNIEIHINSSDWYLHKHDIDKSYNNVILHIVENYDSDIYRENGEKITTAKIRYKQNIIDKYNYLIKNSLKIPCSNDINKVEFFFIRSFLNRLLIERLEVKPTLLLKN